MHKPISLDAADFVMSCFRHCFGYRSPATIEMSYNDKHVRNIRAKLSERAKPSNVPVETAGHPEPSIGRLAAAIPFRKTVEIEGASTTPLTLEELGELFDKIDETLSGPGIPYAIGGLAAMLMFGFTSRGASTVSVIVPAESKDVIRPWALAGGSTVSHKGFPSGFEIRMPGGTVRRVKIRWIPSVAFKKLSISPSTLGTKCAKVLTTASCLEQIASAFLKECKGSKRPQPSKEIETIVSDLKWVLHHAVSSGTRLEVYYLELFLSPDFWSLFYDYLGDRTPEIMLLCTKANLPVGKTLREADHRGIVRQHNALLDYYGGEPILESVQQRLGPFLNMKTLGRHDASSTYTLKSKDSRTDVSTSAEGRCLTRSFPCLSKVAANRRVSPREDTRVANSRVRQSVRSASTKSSHDENMARASMDLVDSSTPRPEGWI